MRALKQLLEVVEANIDGNGESDGGPKRVATANPVPELEHVRRIDAELLHFCGVRAESNEVLRHMRRIFCVSEEPLLSGFRVSNGLLRGECLRCDDEESRLCGNLFENLESKFNT